MGTLGIGALAFLFPSFELLVCSGDELFVLEVDSELTLVDEVVADSLRFAAAIFLSSFFSFFLSFFDSGTIFFALPHGPCTIPGAESDDS